MGCVFPCLWISGAVCVPLASRRKCNVCFCVRVSARISARGVALGVRCAVDVCLFILRRIRVRMSGRINVTELASV